MVADCLRLRGRLDAPPAECLTYLYLCCLYVYGSRVRFMVRLTLSDVFVCRIVVYRVGVPSRGLVACVF